MQPYKISDAVRARIIARQGRLFAHETIDAPRAALLVVDMQNYFVAEGFPAEVSAARGIVPAINRIARALREAGGTVVWIRTTARGALERWANHHLHMLTDTRRAARLAGLAEDAEGFRLFPALESQPGDLQVEKILYSAFVAGSSRLHEILKARGIESLLVAGTATNVCCESTARDAMMLDYRVAMLADANAAATDAEHAAALDAVALFFGDVMTVDEAVARLQPAVERKSA
jgi:ureidoacrylate peracid hydrolase